jgi:hypothetical protein
MIDFSTPYVCGRHGIPDHLECAARYAKPGQMMRRMLERKRKRAVRFVIQRDGYRCRWCRRFGSRKHLPLTLDHFIPLLRGGNNEATNLMMACNGCNNLKGNMMPNDPVWMRIVLRLRDGVPPESEALRSKSTARHRELKEQKI